MLITTIKNYGSAIIRGGRSSALKPHMRVAGRRHAKKYLRSSSGIQFKLLISTRHPIKLAVKDEPKSMRIASLA